MPTLLAVDAVSFLVHIVSTTIGVLLAFVLIVAVLGRSVGESRAASGARVYGATARRASSPPVHREPTPPPPLPRARLDVIA